jgi:hypothetical protein
VQQAQVTNGGTNTTFHKRIGCHILARRGSAKPQVASTIPKI